MLVPFGRFRVGYCLSVKRFSLLFTKGEFWLLMQFFGIPTENRPVSCNAGKGFECNHSQCEKMTVCSLSGPEITPYRGTPDSKVSPSPRCLAELHHLYPDALILDQTVLVQKTLNESSQTKVYCPQAISYCQIQCCKGNSADFSRDPDTCIDFCTICLISCCIERKIERLREKP